MAEGSTGDTKRQAITDALMALLAERSIDDIDVADVAQAARLSLADLRGEFSSVFAILAAFTKEIDRKVLASDFSDMDGEPPREKMFDILMRRLELLAPYKEAVRSLLRTCLRNPALGLAMNASAAGSMAWMMTAAGISTAGPKGAIRAQAMAMLYAKVLSTWIDDDDPGLAKTMSALDRELARGQQWSGFLDTLLAIPERFRAGRWRARRRRDGNPDDGSVAA